MRELPRNACGTLPVVGTGLLSEDGRRSLGFFSRADWRAEGSTNLPPLGETYVEPESSVESAALG